VACSSHRDSILLALVEDITLESVLLKFKWPNPNDHRKKKTLVQFRSALGKLESMAKLPSVLSFCTGSDAGLIGKSIIIKFHDIQADDYVSRFLKSSTCGAWVSLPVGYSNEVFEAQALASILECQVGFGVA
jgi:hypothetical protein